LVFFFPLFFSWLCLLIKNNDERQDKMVQNGHNAGKTSTGKYIQSKKKMKKKKNTKMMKVASQHEHASRAILHVAVGLLIFKIL
jgi:hypothetical protein